MYKHQDLLFWQCVLKGVSGKSLRVWGGCRKAFRVGNLYILKFMKRRLNALLAIVVASMIIFSCSSSKNQGFSGVDRNTHSETKKARSNYDYESAGNYESFAKSYQPSIAQVSDTKVENTSVTETAVASSDSKVAAIAPKHIAQIEKIAKGEKLSKAEIKEVRKSLKEAKSVLKDQENTDATGGGKSQAVALILAIVVTVLIANIIPIHRFYLGGKKNTTAGILQIVFGLLTLGFVSWVWGIIDIIRIALGTLKPGSGDYGSKL